MTNIPDLTNAEPGDVYQDVLGHLWRIRIVYDDGCVGYESHDGPSFITGAATVRSERFRGWEKVE